ncbi:acyl-CoA dehydrogenase family protein [Actinosynnema sp. NPDC023794]
MTRTTDAAPGRVRDLVERYGSPLYVYDLADVADAVADLREVLPPSATLYYSLKANANPSVLRELHRAGCRAEVCSPGELAAAAAAGFDPARCLYTGPGKTHDEVVAALRAGVRTFSVESLGDLRRLSEAARSCGRTPECLVRVNTGGAAGASGLRMAGPSQFGFDVDRAAEWASELDVPDVVVAGLHFFPISDAKDERALLAGFRHSLETAARLRDDHRLPVRLLDLGGGFGAPYAEQGARPDYRGLRAELTAAAAEHFSPDEVELAFESGRHLVGTSGRLVATVTDVKDVRGTRYVVLDSGINHLGGMSGLRRMRPMAARPVLEGAANRAVERVTVVGPLCTPADVLAHDVTLPAARPGDLVVVPNTGAYGLSASLVGFLGRPLPAEVAVRAGAVVGSGRQELVRGPVAAGRPPVELAEQVAPVLRSGAGPVDESAEFPVESVAALRACGLMGLLVPEEFGGLGGGLADLVAVLRVLGGACASTALVFAMHCQQVDAVARFGGDRLRAEVLPRVARGELYLASVTTERGTGGDLFTAAAPLRWSGEEVEVVRDAPVVTGGAHADGYLVTMRAAPEAPGSDVALVYVDRAQARVDVTGDWDPLGMRGTQSTSLRLEAVVPAHQVVGRGRFREVALGSFTPVGMIGWSASWLGVAHQALRELLGALRSPNRPSTVDLSSDLLHERVARIRHDLELVSAYLHGVVEEVSRCREGDGDVSSPVVQQHLTCLKVTTSELTHQAVDRCVQIAGLGLGYRRNSPIPLERHLRDLRAAALNCSNDWLLRANGVLTLADRAVSLLH